jgi:hypothetical protein
VQAGWCTCKCKPAATTAPRESGSQRLHGRRMAGYHHWGCHDGRSSSKSGSVAPQLLPTCRRRRCVTAFLWATGAGHTGAHRLRVKAEGHVGGNESVVQATESTILCSPVSIGSSGGRNRGADSGAVASGERKEKGEQRWLFFGKQMSEPGVLCVCVAVWQRIAPGLFGLSILFKGPIYTGG